MFGPPNREGSVKAKAKFKFTGEEAPARGAAVSATADLSSECRSVRGKKKGEWKGCSSPKRLHLKATGRRSKKFTNYVFKVRATDAAGNTDPTTGQAQPAKHKWKTKADAVALLEAVGVSSPHTLIGVARLALPEMLVEIEATAVQG